MKKITIFSLLILLSAAVFANDPVALILKSAGKIEVTRTEDKYVAKAGENLFDKDELVSGEESFAVVKFVDGSSNVKLFPNSILTIETSQENGLLNKKSTLLVGSILAKVNKKTGLFEVDTPNNVVSVKGTEFIVEVNDAGCATVSVKEGVVEIKNKATGNVTEVSAGKKVTENANGEFDFSDNSNSEFDDSTEGEKNTEVMQIELENETGEKETIEIKFEKR
ncbi:MAG TPA: FecR family protein [Candidatus Cloacimonadota bacterium]|nr:FecR family protein [Candidatus Cloacimonadota bacterium]